VFKSGGSGKSGLTGTVYAQVWRGVGGPFLPPEKNEFGIDGDSYAICVVLSSVGIDLKELGVRCRNV